MKIIYFVSSTFATDFILKDNIMIDKVNVKYYYKKYFGKITG